MLTKTNTRIRVLNGIKNFSSSTRICYLRFSNENVDIYLDEKLRQHFPCQQAKFILLAQFGPFYAYKAYLSAVTFGITLSKYCNSLAYLPGAEGL